MLALIIVVHILVSIILILVVLLQSGKAGDLASAFGGATSQTAFGARGATTFLAKMTSACAVLFMVTSLALSIMYTRGSGSSVVEQIPASQQQVPATQPQTPAQKTTPPAQPAQKQDQGSKSGPAASKEKPAQKTSPPQKQ